MTCHSNIYYCKLIFLKKKKNKQKTAGNDFLNNT